MLCLEERKALHTPRAPHPLASRAPVVMNYLAAWSSIKDTDVTLVVHALRGYIREVLSGRGLERNARQGLL